MAKKKAPKSEPLFKEDERGKRCDKCPACVHINEAVKTSKFDRAWNVELLRNPCAKWPKDIVASILRIMLRCEYIVRPSKKELEAYAAQHGLESMLQWTGSDGPEKDTDS